MTNRLKVFLLCVVLFHVSDSTRNIARSVKTLRNVISLLERSPIVQNEVSKLRENIRSAAIMGLMMGSFDVEHQMERNIDLRMKNLTEKLQSSKPKVVRELKDIEIKVHRDRMAISILKCAMDFVSKARNFKECMDSMKRNEFDNFTTSTQRPAKVKKVQQASKAITKEMQVKIQESYKTMRNDIVASIRDTMKSIKEVDKPKISFAQLPVFSETTLANERLHHGSIQLESPIQLFIADFDDIYRFKRLDEEKQLKEQKNHKKSEKQENEDEEKDDDVDLEFDDAAPPAANGGIGGLIASLSGGEGGSDVGALVGAISGVILNLFGPGGLDVPSLLSTGTSLLAGLLGGDENFGKVLGDYVGLSVEGLSGGGGAENNGEFFGNFIGTLFGYLSADPEEESGPQPKIFFESFVNGFEQTKQKRGADDHPSSNKGYFFEFISNIISSLVGGITSFIANASLGSSGGSSQGSADLSAGSSQGSHAGSAGASSASQSSHKPHKPHNPEAERIRSQPR